MNRILVAYATMAGSTMEVAEVVGEEIAKHGFQADVLPISEIQEIQAYHGVVVGGPMIMGWHREAMRFLKKHRKAFQKIPLAVFVPLVAFHALRLTVPLLVIQEPMQMRPGDVVATINIVLSFVLSWVIYSEVGEERLELETSGKLAIDSLVN